MPQRAKQLLQRNEETRSEALDLAKDELTMIDKVKSLVASVKDSGVLCALCGDHSKHGAVTSVNPEELLNAMSEKKCNQTDAAVHGEDFVKCLQENKDKEQLCALCQPHYSKSHLAAAACHMNKEFVEGEFMVKLGQFNQLWQKRCPKQCLCRDVYEPVCGDDGQTYSNYCRAKCVDVEVAYQGACGAKAGPGEKEAAAAAAQKANKATGDAPKTLIVESKTDSVMGSSDKLVKDQPNTQRGAASSQKRR